MRATIISPLLRGSFRRYASTSSTTTTASSAVNTASESAKKAGETLQQIGARVGPVASNALAALGKVGGRTGALVKKVEGRWFFFALIHGAGRESGIEGAQLQLGPVCSLGQFEKVGCWDIFIPGTNILKR